MDSYRLSCAGMQGRHRLILASRILGSGDHVDKRSNSAAHSRFRSHPWHGVSIGAEAPRIVTCYIEIVPTDTVKYEVDKETSYLKVDRPQKYTNVCPTLYGFIPQTYCAEQVAQLAADDMGRPN